MERGQILNVDTTKSEIQNPLVKLRQGDGNYQTLRVTVRNSGEPINLDGWTITFMGTTANNHKIVDSKVTVEDSSSGIFSYTPTKAWGQDIGEFNKAYFKFTKNDEAASSATFRVNVLEAVDLTQEEAGDYISVVDTLIENVKIDMNTALSDTQNTLAQTQSEAYSTSEAVSTYTAAASQAVSNVNSAASAATSSMANQLEDFKTKDNTFTGKNTFTQLIEGSITGHADTAETATDPEAVHKSDSINIHFWQSNHDYKVGDLVLLNSFGSQTTGLITNGIMICLLDHTSSPNFPSSDDGKWALINNDAYYIEQSVTIGNAIGFKFIRNGESVQGYPTTATTASISSKSSGWTTLSGSLNSALIPTINTDILSIIASTQHVFIWRFLNSGSIQFRQTWGSDGSIGSGSYFSLNAYWSNSSKPSWQSGVPS